MSVLQYQTTRKQSLFCGKHREAMKLFCETCEVSICCECTIVDHKGHQFGYFEEVMKKRQELLAEEIKKATAKRGKVRAVLEKAQVRERKWEKITEHIEKRIDDVINKQIRSLEEKHFNLL